LGLPLRPNLFAPTGGRSHSLTEPLAPLSVSLFRTRQSSWTPGAARAPTPSGCTRCRGGFQGCPTSDRVHISDLRIAGMFSPDRRSCFNDERGAICRCGGNDERTRSTTFVVELVVSAVCDPIRGRS